MAEPKKTGTRPAKPTSAPGGPAPSPAPTPAAQPIALPDEVRNAVAAAKEHGLCGLRVEMVEGEGFAVTCKVRAEMQRDDTGVATRVAQLGGFADKIPPTDLMEMLREMMGPEVYEVTFTAEDAKRARAGILTVIAAACQGIAQASPAARAGKVMVTHAQTGGDQGSAGDERGERRPAEPQPGGSVEGPVVDTSGATPG